MGSIADLSWASSMELFEDLDLDPLYVRQAQVIGGHYYAHYPYILLINTGKMTLGINLGNDTVGAEEPFPEEPLNVNGDYLMDFMPYMSGLSDDDLNDSTLKDKNNLDEQIVIKPKNHANKK